MRLGSVHAFASISLMMVAAVVPAVAMPRAHRGPTSPKLFAPKRPAPAMKPAARPLSQRAIEPNRASQIQGALIKSGYMSGKATGVWDSETEGAMQKLQSDNGWQTKIVPDARAIIKLGLGPNASSPEGEAAAPEAPVQSAADSSKPTIIQQ